MNTPEDSVEEEFGSSKLLPNLLTITTHRVETLTNPTLLSPATGLLVDRRRLAARYARRLAGISSLEDGSAYRSRVPHSTIQTRYHRFSSFSLVELQKTSRPTDPNTEKSNWLIKSDLSQQRLKGKECQDVRLEVN